MKSIAIYLNFEGKTEEAFKLYRSVFGGEFASLQRYRDMPGSEKVKAADKEKLLHIALPLGKTGVALMGSDKIEGFGPNLKMGNNVHISIVTESEEEAKRIVNALSAGGKSIMPLQKQFWGDLYGSFEDKFGANWMVSYSYPKEG
jgi:PhnB protein